MSLSERAILNRLISITDGQFYIDVFKNAGDGKPAREHILVIAEKASKSAKDFVDFLTLVDGFARNHPFFKFFTTVHLSLIHGDLLDPSYKKYYEKSYNQDEEMQTLFKETDDKVFKACIKKPSISGPVA